MRVQFNLEHAHWIDKKPAAVTKPRSGDDGSAIVCFVKNFNERAADRASNADADHFVIAGKSPPFATFLAPRATSLD